MPSVSKAQHAMAVEDLRRLDAGEATRTGMSREQLQEYCDTPTQDLPERVKATAAKAKKGKRCRHQQ